MARSNRRELADLLSAKEMIVVCGSGGTGKTTIAAALGAQAAAVLGGRVLVLTVDPARRLATALGIGSFGNTAVQVAPQAFADAGLPCRGELWVAMLDTKAGWDELIRRHAPDAKLRDTVLANPLYQNITGRFVNSHDYLAMEQLYDLHASGHYDLVVIDTPPSRHAIDVLEAPDRLVRFLSNPVYRALTIPTRSLARVTNAASSAFLWTVKRLAGPQIVQDTVEFFRSISSLEAGLRQRAAEMAELLRADHTAFVLVSSPRAEAIDEASYLATALHDGGFRLGGVVVNMVHPLPPVLHLAADERERIEAGGGPLADQLGYHAELDAIARAERDEMAALVDLAQGAPVRDVPLLDHDVHDLAALRELGVVLVG